MEGKIHHYLSFSSLRLISLVGSAVFLFAFRDYSVGFPLSLHKNPLVTIIWATGVAHFVLGIAYSLNSIQWQTLTPKLSFKWSLIFGGGFLAYKLGLAPNAMQAYHHAASEGYTERTLNSDVRKEQMEELYQRTFWIHLFLFFFMARDAFKYADVVAVNVTFPKALVVFCGTALIYLYFKYILFLKKIWSSLAVNERLTFVLGEVLIAIILIISIFKSFSTLELAVYHRFFWTLYPAALLFRKSLKAFWIYIFLTLVANGALFLSANLPWVQSKIVEIYLVTGVTHILVSIPLSKSNPPLLRSWLSR